MQKFDIIIIGGGPAGSMTGIELQQKGFKTCIVDKSSFPRTKLCGGLLTQKSIDLISKHCPNLDKSNYIVEETNSVDFYFKSERITNYKTNAKYFFTERTVFDNLLIKEYESKGGLIIENARIKTNDIDSLQNTVTIKSKKYQFKFLIGADGCNSILSKKEKIKRYDSFCIEGEIIKESKQEKEFRIYFGVAKNGYGWYFPKNEHYSVGIGGDNSNKMIRNKANLFFSNLTNNQINNVKGAFIPSGKSVNLNKLPKNWLLVGDAAGYIDPITGEGLYYALQSGILAAEAVDISCKNEDNLALKYYLNNVLPIRKEIRFALLLQKALYFPFILKLFMNYLKNHKTFALFYLERVMSTNDSNYRNFIWLYLYKKLQNEIRK